MNALRLKKVGRIATLALVPGFIFGLGQPLSKAQSSAASYGFVSRLTSASLPDPAGKNWSVTQNSGQPTVLILTEPNMSQGGIQQDWVNSLKNLSGQVNFYLVEDMKGQMFQGIALDDMKKDYSEGVRPVVLIDNSGTIRKQQGAPKGKTCVMIFNAKNRLVYVQVGNASSTAVQAVKNAVAGLTN